MARAYTTPGVSVIETANPTLVTGVGVISRVALVGLGQGFEQATERVVLSGVTAALLLHTGLDLTNALAAEATRSPLVKLTSTGETLNPGTYLIKVGTDPNTSVTGDEPYTIERIAHPTTAPTATPSGTGLTGVYDYAIAFINARGETGIGPASNQVTLTNQGVNLTNIPLAPAQTGVTAQTRAVYRRKVSGTGADNLYHLVAVIPDNTTTTYSDTAADNFNAAQPFTGIASGATVSVTYKFTDNMYFEPELFDDIDDVQDKFGPAFDADGNISSKLSFAARLAFANGVSELILQAVVTDNSAGYSTAFDKLKSDATVAFVVPITGDSGVHSSLVSGHITPMNAEGQYRMAIVGRDGSVTTVPAATLRSAALSFSNEAVTLISPSAFGYINPETSREMILGGQYAAAVVAGMYGGRDPQVPLTRKTVGSFSSVKDLRSESEKQQDSSSGLLVIEDKGGVLRVRHGVTTKPGNPNTQEGSVVRAKYELARRIHNTLDQNVIGLVAPLDEVPNIIKSTVAGVLQNATSEGLISGWGDVKARTLSGDPTTVEVRFEYTPAYPVNRVEVRFRLNTESGVFELTP